MRVRLLLANYFTTLGRSWEKTPARFNELLRDSPMIQSYVKTFATGVGEGKRSYKEALRQFDRNVEMNGISIQKLVQDKALAASLDQSFGVV